MVCIFDGTRWKVLCRINVVMGLTDEDGICCLVLPSQPWLMTGHLPSVVEYGNHHAESRTVVARHSVDVAATGCHLDYLLDHKTLASIPFEASNLTPARPALPSHSNAPWFTFKTRIVCLGIRPLLRDIVTCGSAGTSSKVAPGSLL